MPNFIIHYQHDGQLHELEFTSFPFDLKMNYQVVRSTLDLLPEGIRYTIETTHFPLLSLPRSTMELDPRIQSTAAKVAYFSVYAAIIQHLEGKEAIKFTCSIESAEKYL